MVRKRGETRGRKTDHARRRQIVDFRAQGWTFARIGAYFGVSRQCVQTLYRLSGNYEALPGICCCACGVEICPWDPNWRGGMHAVHPVYCLNCLSEHPEAALGARIKAFRVQARLTQEELGDKLGLHYDSIGRLERAEGDPNWTTIAKLIDLFGIQLIAYRTTSGADGPRQGKFPLPRKLSGKRGTKGRKECNAASLG